MERQAKQRSRHRTLVGASLLMLAGCGVALERTQVQRRFQAVFGCPADRSKVMSTAGGYRVEGCGRVAHFRCFDTDDDIDERYHERGAVGAVLDAMLDGALDADTCILEHTESYPPSAPPPAVAVRREPKGSVLKARALLAGGHLRLFAQPAKYPEHLLLTVYRIAPLSPEPCEAALFMDGSSVPLREIRRTTDHEVRLLVRAADLREAHRAVRLSGSVCGFEFELDAHGRETVGLFEARLREEVARGRHAQSSGGERPRDG